MDPDREQKFILLIHVDRKTLILQNMWSVLKRKWKSQPLVCKFCIRSWAFRLCKNSCKNVTWLYIFYVKNGSKGMCLSNYHVVELRTLCLTLQVLYELWISLSVLHCTMPICNLVIFRFYDNIKNNKNFNQKVKCLSFTWYCYVKKNNEFYPNSSWL